MTGHIAQVRTHRGISTAIIKMFIAAAMLHLIGETALWVE